MPSMALVPGRVTEAGILNDWKASSEELKTRESGNLQAGLAYRWVVWNSVLEEKDGAGS